MHRPRPPSGRRHATRRDATRTGPAGRAAGGMAIMAMCLLLGMASWNSMSAPLLVSVVAAPSMAAVAGSINTVYFSLFQQALLAYQLQVPSFSNVKLSINSGDLGRVAAASTNFDFTVASGSMTDVMRFTNPTLEAYPIAAVGIVAAYNLPSSVGTATLTIHNEVLCRIWRGNITHWNDPAIVATNPTLSLPGERIRVLQFDFVNDSTLAAARLCTRVDGVWAATIGAVKKPDLAHVVRISQAQNGGGFASYVLDHPYTIGVVSPSAVRPRTAQLINQAGMGVSASPATVAQAFLELAGKGVVPNGGGLDLSNAQSAFAWPMNMGAFLFIDRDVARSTCATKAEVLKFLLWMYESPVAAALADTAGIALPPALYLKQSGLLDRIRREVLCDGHSLVLVDSTSASVRGNAMIASSVNLMTQLYAQVDPTYTYSFRAMADGLALDRIAVGEIDFAIISPTALTDDQVHRFRAPYVDDQTGAMMPGGMILPAFLAGVVPTFSLPLAITSLYATRSTGDDLGLPDLYPLTIDLETLARVFTGGIRSWLHADMRALNPQLEAWFGRTGAPANLTSVVCCTDDADPFVGGFMLARHLLDTQAVNETLGAAGVAAAQLDPRSMWKALQATHTAPSSMEFVDREATIPSKLLMIPSSISYRLFSTAYAVPSTDFMVRVTDMHGRAESVPANSDNLIKCVEPFVGEEGFMQLLATGVGQASQRVAPGCYPLQAMASLAVGRSFSSAKNVDTAVTVTAAAGDAAASHQTACVRAQKNLELLRWLQVSPVLSGALRNSGIMRLSDLPAVRSFLVDQRLNTATCDGRTILITLPIVWSVPHAATIFAIVIAAFIIAACAATVAGLYKFRHHTAIRGASPLFLAQVAVGLALLAGSMVAWAAPVTESSCLTFQWMVNLGFTLAFAPLFAKTWRIYQIFSAKKIKVVKITNGRLVWAVLAMLGVELVLLAVWTGVSPLQPVLFEQATNQLDGAIRQLTHCAMDGAAGTAFLAVEASFKGALLLFGCMMGFSTRKVAASFNESQTIAWAIYNVVFSSLVVGAILLFLDTLGDTLIWLVLMLFLWTAAGTWALIFVGKASAVLGAEDHAQHNAHSISLGSLSKNDGSITFASITGFGRAQLLAYRTALEAQLDKVRRALGLANVQAGSEGKVLNQRTDLLSNRSVDRASADEAHEHPTRPYGHATTVTATHTAMSPTAVSTSASSSQLTRPTVAHSRKVAPSVGLKAANESSPHQWPRTSGNQSPTIMSTAEHHAALSSYTSVSAVPQSIAQWALHDSKPTAVPNAGAWPSQPDSAPLPADRDEPAAAPVAPRLSVNVSPLSGSGAHASSSDVHGEPASAVRVAVSLAPRPSSRAQATPNAHGHSPLAAEEV